MNRFTDNLDSRKLIEYLKLISFRNLFSSILQSFGALWLIIKVGDYFFGNFEWVNKIPDYWYIFLLAGITIGFFRACPRLKICENIAGTDVDIEVKIKDIFSSNNAIIAGCNTTFDISVKEGIISEECIQGQYLTRYFKKESELEEEIKQELNKLHPLNIIEREKKQLGNFKEYEIGTTVVVGKKRKAYLVAITKLNIHFNAEIDDESFLFDALPKMWIEIRSKGNMESLDCPILGSGRARLKRNRQQILFELIKSFIVATRDGKLTERITFYISYDDFKKGRINMKELKNFLKYECTQHYVSPTKNPPKGTPV